MKKRTEKTNMDKRAEIRNHQQTPKGSRICKDH